MSQHLKYVGKYKLSTSLMFQSKYVCLKKTNSHNIVKTSAGSFALQSHLSHTINRIKLKAGSICITQREWTEWRKVRHSSSNHYPCQRMICTYIMLNLLPVVVNSDEARSTTLLKKTLVWHWLMPPLYTPLESFNWIKWLDAFHELCFIHRWSEAMSYYSFFHLTSCVILSWPGQ